MYLHFFTASRFLLVSQSLIFKAPEPVALLSSLFKRPLNEWKRRYFSLSVGGQKVPSVWLQVCSGVFCSGCRDIGGMVKRLRPAMHCGEREWLEGFGLPCNCDKRNGFKA